MCGIIGAITKNINILPSLLAGLKRLEYRGYDSAGFSIIQNGKKDQRPHLVTIKRVGKVIDLIKATDVTAMHSNIGIAHTRWATHGAITQANSHPHVVGDRVAVVHNGIIENYETLRQQLNYKTYKLQSDTDSEVIAALIYEQLEQVTLEEATKIVKNKLKGAFSFVVMDLLTPEYMMAVKASSPLIVGIHEEGIYIASDLQAFPEKTKQIIHLVDGDVIRFSAQKFIIYDETNKVINRKVQDVFDRLEIAEKGNFAHFMEKEIFEQPNMLKRCLSAKFVYDTIDANSCGLTTEILQKTQHIQIVACGTSYYAGLVGKYWFEEIVSLSCNVDIASEFCYRKHVLPENTLFITLSQSGETADTLGALKSLHTPNSSYFTTLTICNNKASTLVLASDHAYVTNIGPEVGVASTKNFTAQLIALLNITLLFAKTRKIIDDNTFATYVKHVQMIPQYVQEVLALDKQIKNVSFMINRYTNAIYLGRGAYFPIALEGALKLKELAYIHAEAYPGGELKHGPLALVDKNMPVIVLAPYDDMWDKIKINFESVHARGAKLFIFTDKINNFIPPAGSEVIYLPKIPNIIMPIMYVIPLQLLAYYVAVIRGTDVDNPRNLAKSVTVE